MFQKDNMGFVTSKVSNTSSFRITVFRSPLPKMLPSIMLVRNSLSEQMTDELHSPSLESFTNLTCIDIIFRLHPVLYSYNMTFVNIRNEEFSTCFVITRQVTSEQALIIASCLQLLLADITLSNLSQVGDVFRPKLPLGVNMWVHPSK